MPARERCPHGHTVYTEGLVDDGGRSSCCGAYTSIFADDGSEYCKCCGGTIVGGAETPTVRIDVR